MSVGVWEAVIISVYVCGCVGGQNEIKEDFVWCLFCFACLSQCNKEVLVLT